jgi:1,4-alpha-glucan branching enzyme
MHSSASALGPEWVSRAVSIYQVHLGSWRRVPEDGDRPLTYRELAVHLPPYAAGMGFTHVEILNDLDGLPAEQSEDCSYLVDALRGQGLEVLFETDRAASLFAFDQDWLKAAIEYFRHDPIHRSYLQSTLTFPLTSARPTNPVLGLRYQDVSGELGSMISRMPGDRWQKFANLRAFYGFMFGCPGKKVLFMGSEFGQWKEWERNASLDWHLLADDAHRGVQRWVRDLNTFYRGQPALHEGDAAVDGFQWIDSNDAPRSVVSFLRWSAARDHAAAFVCNFTPVPRSNYRIGVPWGGRWSELMNSDATLYGGSGQGNFGKADAAPVPMHGHPFSINITLPPLAVMAFLGSMPSPEDREWSSP